jgi:hypothetical protein
MKKIIFLLALLIIAIHAWEDDEDECSVNFNNKHCGERNKECTSCIEGHCVCLNSHDCNGECVNTKYDINHCGACNHKCPANEVCINSICTCPNSDAFCLNGSSGTCTSCSSGQYCDLTNNGGTCTCRNSDTFCLNGGGIANSCSACPNGQNCDATNGNCACCNAGSCTDCTTPGYTGCTVSGCCIPNGGSCDLPGNCCSNTCERNICCVGDHDPCTTNDQCCSELCDTTTNTCASCIPTGDSGCGTTSRFCCDYASVLDAHCLANTCCLSNDFRCTSNNQCCSGRCDLTTKTCFSLHS